MDLEFAKSVVKVESQTISGLAAAIDSNFEKAARMVFECRGRVVVTGMGKPGIIAQKISATLASTGTPSIYLHPAEAIHGDLGRVGKDDVVLVLSNSGESDEIVRLLPPLKRIGAAVVAVTGAPESSLARYSDVVINIGRIEEPCPLGLAPTASTIALLAIGDALALTVLNRRDFGERDFALYHPGGDLGRKLLTVEEVMRKGERNLTLPPDMSVREALTAITNAKDRPGATSIVDDGAKLLGFFTDGDLRRHLLEGNEFLDKPIEEVMTRTPDTVQVGCLATEALRILREKERDQLPVLDENSRVVGIIDVQDLLRVGLVSASPPDGDGS